MWIVIGAIALFILYIVIKKNSNKTDSNQADPIEKEVSLEKTIEAKDTSKESAKKSVTPKTESVEKVKAEPAATKPTTAKKPAAKKPAAKKAEAATDNSEYGVQYSSLNGKYKQAKEFKLFDTKAAFFWNEGDSTITLLSITAFVKGEAKTTTYGTYSFNVNEWAWDGDQPKGCAAEIKKSLSDSFKKGENA